MSFWWQVTQVPRQLIDAYHDWDNDRYWFICWVFGPNQWGVTIQMGNNPMFKGLKRIHLGRWPD